MRLIQQHAIDCVLAALSNTNRFGCKRVKGGLSFTQLIGMTRLDGNTVNMALKALLLHRVIMTFHVDATCRYLYYIRPPNWED